MNCRTTRRFSVCWALYPASAASCHSQHTDPWNTIKNPPCTLCIVGCVVARQPGNNTLQNYPSAGAEPHLSLHPPLLYSLPSATSLITSPLCHILPPSPLFLFTVPLILTTIEGKMLRQVSRIKIKKKVHKLWMVQVNISGYKHAINSV